MGGHTLDSWNEAQKTLETFWNRYSNIDPNVPAIPSCTMPMYLHGDEGRGLGKRPLLVISYQPVMGWTGGGRGGRVPSTKYPNKIQKEKVFSRVCLSFFGGDPRYHARPTPCKHTYTARLVFTTVPSECYAPNAATVNALLKALVGDLNELERHGLEAGCSSKLVCQFFQKVRYNHLEVGSRTGSNIPPKKPNITDRLHPFHVLFYPRMVIIHPLNHYCK